VDASAGAVTGLFYGGGINQLVAQAIGSFCVTTATFGTSLALMFVLKRAGVLRLSRERELQGIDVTEHGGPAYPELVPLDAADPSRKLLTTNTTATTAELRP